MLRPVTLTLVVGLSLFAGCADDPAPVDPSDGLPQMLGTPGYDYNGPGHLFAGPALYEDPQNTPHPAYNWPTLSHPAVGSPIPRYWLPNNGTDLPASITELVHVVQTPGVSAGAGIALFGSLAIVPSYSTSVNSSIVDISDPTNPKVIGSFLTQLSSHRGATIIAYPTGQLVTVISTGSGLDVWDISDPTHPMPLTPVEVPSHKVGVIPGTPFVYNARSDGGNGGLVPGPGSVDPSLAEGIIDMYDFSDPANVVTLAPFENGYGCHHIYFWNNVTQEKYRAICAGIEYTQIIDTKIPTEPKVIVSVPYGHGNPNAPSGSASLAAFAHYAGLSRDGKVLLVGDESGGGLGPIGCIARVDTPAGAVSAPVGAVWFYDVSVETQPEYLGHVSASQLERQLGGSGPTASCTAHHGRLIPVAEGDVLAMSFYGAGVIVVDFSPVRGETPGLPMVIAQYADGSNTWETWYYNGHLYTGDMARGMDILDLE